MTLTTEKQEKLVRRAMTLAAETAAKGNLPFAALLVNDNGVIVQEAVNTVNSTHNAAAHAEINLLFDVSRTIGANDLSEYMIISNAASCPMCITALIKAKITLFYFGAQNEATMVPNITMNEIVDKTPFPIEIHGGILAKECADQIRQLTRR